jgi:hypothetical protein
MFMLAYSDVKSIYLWIGSMQGTANIMIGVFGLISFKFGPHAGIRTVAYIYVNLERKCGMIWTCDGL